KGSGQRFVVNAERMDGFEGEIRIEISEQPKGMTISSPIIIEEGHSSAFGTGFASPDASTNTGAVTLTATARINGETVTHEAGDLGKLSLGETAPLYADLDPTTSGPPEIPIAPGESVRAFIRVRRNGHN